MTSTQVLRHQQENKINEKAEFRNNGSVQVSSASMEAFLCNEDQCLVAQLTERAIDWAQCHGFSMRTKNSPDRSDSVEFIPFTLFPTIFPRKMFEKAMELQKDYSLLYHKIGADFEFLESTLAPVLEIDEFTRRLFQIFQQVHNEGLAQPVSLSIYRSDYMVQNADLASNLSSKVYDHQCNKGSINAEQYDLKQVEINAIAASSASNSINLLNLHRSMAASLCGQNSASRFSLMEQLDVHIPDENRSMQVSAEGLIEAWKVYRDHKAAILFVVEESVSNICDQRRLEFEIERQSNYAIRVIRLTLKDIAETCTLDETTRVLSFRSPYQSIMPINGAVNGKSKHSRSDDQTPIAVAYFRSGYAPDQYPTETEWAARLKIERSSAIKCPSIGGHLAGTKKVQQALAKPGAVERFLGNGSAAAGIRNTFMPMYGFDSSLEIAKALEVVKKNPENYVLKPQREGGGNNIYGPQVLETLEHLKPNELQTLMLMQRIRPIVSKNYVIRPQAKDPARLIDLVSELGTFGYILGSGSDVSKNVAGGYLLRTKPATANEGGIAVGIASLSTPFLV